MELLRFSSSGSVDDGKSTLIGRLLYDSKSFFEDQLQEVSRASVKKGLGHIDFSLFTDGLKAEREKGITIDVAYRYFQTQKRKFIIADTPGHFEYVRNMVTGASTANLSLVLVDATRGITEQTFRHSFIASLLQIPHLVVCVNKMDLVNFDEKVFDQIVSEYKNFSSKLDVRDIHFIPISSLHGDNVVEKSPRMPWYGGSPLLFLLENVYISSDVNLIDSRFPIQYVIESDTSKGKQPKQFAGRIASGIFRKGDRVRIFPSGLTSTITSIEQFEKKLEEAYATQSVSLVLSGEPDIRRGDLIVKEHNIPVSGNEMDVMVCWLDASPMMQKKNYILRHTSNETACLVSEILYKVDMSKLTRNTEDKTIVMNDIGRISIRTEKPLFYDSYRKNKITGSIILIDEETNETVAAGMIV